MEKVTFTIKSLKLLAERSNYGYLDKSRFYRATDDNDVVYVISTTQFLGTGDTIRANITGSTTYNGENQTRLSKVKILNCNFNAPERKYTPKSVYIGNLISTE